MCQVPAEPLTLPSKLPLPNSSLLALARLDSGKEDLYEASTKQQHTSNAALAPKKLKANQDQIFDVEERCGVFEEELAEEEVAEEDTSDTTAARPSKRLRPKQGRKDIEDLLNFPNEVSDSGADGDDGNNSKSYPFPKARELASTHIDSDLEITRERSAPEVEISNTHSRCQAATAGAMQHSTLVIYFPGVAESY